MAATMTTMMKPIMTNRRDNHAFFTPINGIQQTNTEAEIL